MSSEKKNLRDYGLPDSEVTGTPTWEATEHPCPNCGGLLCQVQVTVQMPMLRGGHGLSTYLGCPACPYASPAVVRSDAAAKKAESPGE
jgi:hypothetical protein